MSRSRAAGLTWEQARVGRRRRRGAAVSSDRAKRASRSRARCLRVGAPGVAPGTCAVGIWMVASRETWPPAMSFMVFMDQRPWRPPPGSTRGICREEGAPETSGRLGRIHDAHGAHRGNHVPGASRRARAGPLKRGPRAGSGDAGPPGASWAGRRSGRTRRC